MLVHPWRYFFLSIFSGALILGLVQTAKACSCGGSPTVLDSFDYSDEVVLLRAIGVEKAEDTEKDHYVDGVRRTTMVVEKVFKGKLKVNEQIVFGQGGGADCIWTFAEESVGRQYLVYLMRPEKRSSDYRPFKDSGLWLVSVCGRSTGLKGATEDLLYLENMQKLRGKTRISGTLGGWKNPDMDVENKRIRIIGAKKTYETKTDKNGVFEIYDLPPGKYFIEPETPAGWKLDATWLAITSASVVVDENGRPELKTPRQVAITLEPKKHASVELAFEPDNFVRGRVLGPRGKPLPGVSVYLLRPGAKGGPFGRTDEQGRYEIASVDPGEYVLGANHDDKPSAGEPFHQIFYPGVSERERAVVISVRPGENLENMDFVIPKLEETVIIKGVLLYSDGNPVVKEWVKFDVTKDSEKVYGVVNGETDSAGRFTLKVLKGFTGELVAEVRLWPGDYKDCPKVDELLAKSGQKFITVYSNVIELTTDLDAYEVELKFPFPQCEKAEP